MSALDPATNAEARRVLALVAGVALLAGPRRTRPLAGFLYGVGLSRVHGASLKAAQDAGKETIERLFSEKTSVGRRVDDLEAVLVALLGGANVSDRIDRHATSSLDRIRERRSLANVEVRP